MCRALVLRKGRRESLIDVLCRVAHGARAGRPKRLAHDQTERLLVDVHHVRPARADHTFECRVTGVHVTIDVASTTNRELNNLETRGGECLLGPRIRPHFGSDESHLNAQRRQRLIAHPMRSIASTVVDPNYSHATSTTKTGHFL